jgi:predicted alpha/beta hydrolase
MNRETATAFRQQQIVTADGHTIVARVFEPPGAPSGAVLIAPAMGVSQNYYAPLAAWLADQGFVTATFDYRGTGLSRRGSLRGFEASVVDWAQLDCAAMVEALAARAPRLYWLGHSLGGQILAFVPNHARVTKMITIATGSGYWRENAAPLRRNVWWLWFVVVPLALPLFGYFPGKPLRMVDDLPRGVMAQWRRWCLHPAYAVGAEGEPVRALYESVRLPIVSISFSDDEFMSARNIASIHAAYANAPLKMRRIEPKDIGVERIGHFGFFRPAFETTLWQLYLLPELR